jgi:hypothetical protein
MPSLLNPSVVPRFPPLRYHLQVIKRPLHPPITSSWNTLYLLRPEVVFRKSEHLVLIHSIVFLCTSWILVCEIDSYLRLSQKLQLGLCCSSAMPAGTFPWDLGGIDKELPFPQGCSRWIHSLVSKFRLPHTRGSTGNVAPPVRLPAGGLTRSLFGSLASCTPGHKVRTRVSACARARVRERWGSAVNPGGRRRRLPRQRGRTIGWPW